MHLQLDPFSPTGVSVQDELKQIVPQSNGYIGDAGLPRGGTDNQILQKSSGASIWGVAITVSSTQPTSPAINDLWIDTT